MNAPKRELGSTRTLNVLACLLLSWALLQCRVLGQSSLPRVISVEPKDPAGAEVLRRGADPQRGGWSAATTDTNYSDLHPGDQLRVKDNGRAAVRWTDNTIIRLDRGSQLEVPELAEQGLIARLRRGIAYFF